MFFISLIVVETHFSHIFVLFSQIAALLLVSGKVGNRDAFGTCYIYRNTLFSHDFFTRFSWSGGSRKGIQKVMFRKYGFFQEFFIKLVRQSHPSFTEASYEEFFKNRILKNSASRAKCKGIRNSSAKYRSAGPKMETLTALDVSNENPDDQIENFDGINAHDGSGESKHSIGLGVSNENAGIQIENVGGNVYDSGESKHSTNTVSNGDVSIPTIASGTPVNDGKSTAITDSIILSEASVPMATGANIPIVSIHNIVTSASDSIVHSNPMMLSTSTKRVAHRPKVIKRKRTRRVDQFNLESNFLLDESSAESEIEFSNEVSFLMDRFALLRECFTSNIFSFSDFQSDAEDELPLVKKPGWTVTERQLTDKET